MKQNYLVQKIENEPKLSNKGNYYTLLTVSGCVVGQPDQPFVYTCAGFSDSGRLVKQCEVGKSYAVTLVENDRGWVEWAVIEPLQDEKIISHDPVDDMLAEIRARRAVKGAVQ